jgi:hypothetical protein
MRCTCFKNVFLRHFRRNLKSLEKKESNYISKHLRGTSTVYQSIIFHNDYAPEGSVNGRSMNKLCTNALQNVQQHGCQPEIN